MREQLHIGEVAALVGVSPKTIRYYHKVGLLAEPGRTEAGYRLYTAQDLLHLQRVRRLRALGLPLERIKEILGKPDSEHELALRHALQMLVEELTAPLTTFRGKYPAARRYDSAHLETAISSGDFCSAIARCRTVCWIAALQPASPERSHVGVFHS